MSERPPTILFGEVEYVRADVVEGLREALTQIVRDWDGEPEDMAEARAALSSSAASSGGGAGVVRATIYRAIRDYHLSNMRDADGGPYPLVDAMTCDGSTIADGEEQMNLLVDEIMFALAAPPAPTATET